MTKISPMVDCSALRPRASKRIQVGFTLLELLVAMAIGLIIVAAGLSLLRTSLSQHHSVSYRAELQKEAFFVSHVLKQQIAQMGYRPIDPARLNDRIMPIDEKLKAFPEVPGLWESGQSFKLTDTALSYRFYGASFADSSADSSIFDCLGKPIAQGQLQQNEISLQGKELTCITDTDTGVISGQVSGVTIENIAFEIGVDDDGDAIVDRLMDGSVASDADFTGARLLTVRLLLATPDRVASDTRSYFFNGVEQSTTDRKLRLESEISMALRN